MDHVKEAAARRAEALAGQRHADKASGVPSGPARLQPFAAKELRAEKVELDGEERFQTTGYATVFDREYEMWDFFGPYNEDVAGGAADATLAANPDVAFLVNHRGVTMARTISKTTPLKLEADALGLRSQAWLNPKRQDVRDLVTAIDDQNITEMSFAFWITDGEWDDDYETFTIKAFDINRGDVSAVNYGANPYTSIAARAREILADLDHLPAGAARAAMSRLAQRLPDLGNANSNSNGNGERGSQTPAPMTDPADIPATEPTTEPTGMSVNLVRARLALMDTTKP